MLQIYMKFLNYKIKIYCNFAAENYIRILKNTFRFLLLGLILSSYACNSTKVLREGEVMLVRNEVKFAKKSKKNTDLIYYVRPIPTKKFLDAFPIKTSIYAWGYPKYNAEGDSIIKDTKFKRWLRKNGESPILLDTTLISYSERQFKIALGNDGFFEPDINHKIKYIGKKKKKAKVVYTVNANNQYYVRAYNYQLKIPGFNTLVSRDTINSLLKVEKPYSADALIQERNRITAFLRNNGYYHFNNSYLSFEVDTLNASEYLIKNHKTVAVDIILSYPPQMTSINPKVHQKYEFGNVYLQTNFKSSYSGALDTVLYIPKKQKFLDSTLYYFITPVKINKKGDTLIAKDYRYKIIANCIRFKTNYMFNQNEVVFTYNRFNEMRNFVFTDISFFESDTSLRDGSSDYSLNSKVLLTRSKTHSPVFEITARTDKVSASIGYINRNLFKGAETFRVNLYAATDITSKTNNENRFFELGSDIGLDFPRLLFFPNIGNKISRYKTMVNLGVNYQSTRYYERFIYNTAANYYWSEKLNNRHIVTPVDLGFVKVNPFEGFDNYMKDFSRYIHEKYKSHLLMISRYTFSHVSKAKTGRKSLFNVLLSVESCGNTLTAFMAVLQAPRNNEGQWTAFGVKYFNYVRFDADFRYSYFLNSKNSVATRLSLGAGIPLFNSTVMPFERSFYLGGSNSMRAWAVRSLGPGSYYTPDNIKRIERIGDLKLEMNLEYRGTIYKFVKFGIFADAGNVWLYKKDVSMPDGEFQLNRFYKEIALNTGAGLRFDFNFFLLRIDLGIPIYDPNKLPDERVINSSIKFKDCLITFGINHAF